MTTTTLAEQITETYEVRRNNGQCDYGQWIPLADDDAESCREEITDIIAEHSDLATDTVEVRGQRWTYRRVTADTIGTRVGQAIAREVLADPELPREWTGLDGQDGDILTAAGLTPDTPDWDLAVRAARQAYLDTLASV